MHDLMRPGPRSLSASLSISGPGIVELAPLPYGLVCIHVGASVDSVCQRGGERYRGLEVHGGIDIIPAGTASVWEIKQQGTTLVLRVPDGLIEVAAEEYGVDPAHVRIANRFQIRDPQIEHLAWAIKAEMDAGYPAGRLFLDSLGTAIAAQLLQRHSSVARPARAVRGGLSGFKLKQLLAYIEDHLDGDLSLVEVAAIVDLSVSHLKTLFRQSTGVSVHQYVIRRRVDRAGELLRAGKLSTSEIALATGFAHQSHLARHMRRQLGVTPSMMRDADRQPRPAERV
jgi:AraC family transcriptional regulator